MGSYGDANIPHSRQSLGLFWGHVRGDILRRQAGGIFLSLLEAVERRPSQILDARRRRGPTHASCAALAGRAHVRVKDRAACQLQGLKTTGLSRAARVGPWVARSSRRLSHLTAVDALILKGRGVWPARVAKRCLRLSLARGGKGWFLSRARFGPFDGPAGTLPPSSFETFFLGGALCAWSRRHVPARLKGIGTRAGLYQKEVRWYGRKTVLC